MPKSILLLTAAPIAVLTACGSSSTTTTTTTNTVAINNTSNVGIEDNATAPDNAVLASAPVAANTTVAAPTGSLAAYEGKQPFDKIAGKTFTETDAVKAAVATSGADAGIRKWLLDLDGPAGPIVMKDGKLTMTECQEHNCGDHNWIIAIAPDGTGAEICYYDAKAGPKPRWFVDGKPADRPPVGDAGCIQPDH
jgi:hypothetical protein